MICKYTRMNYEFCELVVTQMIVFKLNLTIVFVVSTLNNL